MTKVGQILRASLRRILSVVDRITLCWMPNKQSRLQFLRSAGWSRSRRGGPRPEIRQPRRRQFLIRRLRKPREIRRSSSSQVTFCRLPSVICHSPCLRLIGKVKDDGTVTLIYNRVFHAAGKRTGELGKEIRDFYVPAYFINLTVTVRISADRFFYVGWKRSGCPASFPIRLTSLFRKPSHQPGVLLISQISAM